MRPAGLAIALALGGPAAADMISTEGMAPYEVCGLCHGLDGNSAMAKFPRLAGQKADYITKQIGDFRSGARDNDGGQMQAVVTEIAVEDIAEIAAWFAGQTVALPPDTTPAKTVSPEGEALVERLGCGTCHFTDSPPDGLTPPHITAQHQSYLEKQLRAFRDGDRANDPGGVMRAAASPLTDAEISAIAAYLAALPR